MRLPPIPPEALSPELRVVHDEVVNLMVRTQGRVVMRDETGALIGPFPALLHFPKFGVPVAVFQRALAAEAKLAGQVREVAILTVGAAFGARYELYAHEITGVEVGLSASQVATLAAGGRPADLTEEKSVAHDVARALTAGRILPTSTYERALKLLGRDGLGELVYLIAGYCMISMLLNCYDVPIPERAA